MVIKKKDKTNNALKYFVDAPIQDSSLIHVCLNVE